AVSNEAVAKRARLIGWIEGGFERAVGQLAAALGIDADDDLARIEKDIVEGPHLPLPHWADAAAALEEGSKTDREQARRLAAAVAAAGEERIERYFSVFLNQDKEPRDRLMTGGSRNLYPANPYTASA